MDQEEFKPLRKLEELKKAIMGVNRGSLLLGQVLSEADLDEVTDEDLHKLKVTIQGLNSSNGKNDFSVNKRRKEIHEALAEGLNNIFPPW